jgi:hypothetical protein
MAQHTHTTSRLKSALFRSRLATPAGGVVPQINVPNAPVTSYQGSAVMKSRIHPISPDAVGDDVDGSGNAPTVQDSASYDTDKRRGRLRNTPPLSLDPDTDST